MRLVCRTDGYGGRHPRCILVVGVGHPPPSAFEKTALATLCAACSGTSSRHLRWVCCTACAVACSAVVVAAQPQQGSGDSSVHSAFPSVGGCDTNASTPNTAPQGKNRWCMQADAAYVQILFHLRSAACVCTTPHTNRSSPARIILILTLGREEIRIGHKGDMSWKCAVSVVGLLTVGGVHTDAADPRWNKIWTYYNYAKGASPFVGLNSEWRV
jgi:hypothetical protein